MPNNNWIMHASRDLLVARFLGGPETEKTRNDAAKAWNFVKKNGGAPSPNMLKLATLAGFELGDASTADVQATIDADIRSSWFNQKCGIKNEQLSWSHGVTEAFPEVCAYLRGFQDAAVNLMRISNYVRLVDPFKLGRCFTTGMRTPPKVTSADFLDDLAKMVRGDRMTRTKEPSAQEAAWLIQEKAPELLEPNDYGLPPVMQPTTVTLFERAVLVETPTMPQGRFGGPTSMRHVNSGMSARSYGKTIELVGVGERLDFVTLPQGVA